MRNPPRPGRHPFVLAIEVRWRDGTSSRHMVRRYSRADDAVRDAKRARTTWSQLLGAWHWPPRYLVTDQRDGTQVYPSHPTEGSASDGEQEDNIGRLF